MFLQHHRYSIVFVHLGYSLLLMLLFRALLIPRLHWRKEEARKTVYLTLYAIPLMALCHAILAGLLCKYGFMERIIYETTGHFRFLMNYFFVSV